MRIPSVRPNMVAAVMVTTAFLCVALHPAFASGGHPSRPTARQHTVKGADQWIGVWQWQQAKKKSALTYEFSLKIAKHGTQYSGTYSVDAYLDGEWQGEDGNQTPFVGKVANGRLVIEFDPDNVHPGYEEHVVYRKSTGTAPSSATIARSGEALEWTHTSGRAIENIPRKFLMLASSPATSEAPQSDEKFEMTTVKRVFGKCENDGSSECATLTLTYPVFSQEFDHAVRMNGLVLALALRGDDDDATAAPPTVDQFAEAFFSEFREFRKDVPNAPVGWEREINVDVSDMNSRFVSLRKHTYEYTGGAHPITFATYVTYSLTDFHQVTLPELFGPDYVKKLNPVVEKYFRIAREIPAGQSLEDAGFTFENGFSVNDNFTVDRDGLTFYYNPYEVAPYVMGPTEVHVSADDLIPLLADKTVTP